MKTYTFKYFAVAATILFFLASCARNTKTEFDMQNDKIKEIISALSDSIKATKYFPDKDVRAYLHKEFDRFYKGRDFELAWLSFDEPLKQSQDLLEAIDNADREGLEPENYNLSEIEKLLKTVYKVESKKEKRKHRRAKKSLNKNVANRAWEKDTLRLYNIARLDFLMTSSYLTYASHLLSGKINPNEKETWFSKPRKRELADELEKALKSNDIAKSLENLLPKHPQYGLLKNELEKLKKLEAKDTFGLVTLIQPLKPGAVDPALDVVRKRLGLLGDLRAANPSTLYDSQTVNSVRHFQLRYGLDVTGIITPETVAMLNDPIKEQIEKVKINMERMRWLPDNFGDRYILVNIPEYKMRLYENGKKAMEMKVIVGTNYKATPVISDTLEYIVFSPTWTVPNEIAVEEMLPHLKKDPSYLDKKGYFLYDSWKEDAEPLNSSAIDWNSMDSTNFKFRIVEKPGVDNSLGLVKFMMPNSEDIYLHDTPGHNLFNKNKRSFSHGCIRLERPRDLAQYLLKDNGWDSQKVDEHLKPQEKSEFINLSKRVPVHIVYWTAWVDDENVLNFREDIYHHDEKQEIAIKKKESTF